MRDITGLFKEYKPRKVEEDEGITIASLEKLGDFFLKLVIEEGRLNSKKSKLYYRTQEKGKPSELYELQNAEGVIKEMWEEYRDEIKKRLRIK